MSRLRPEPIDESGHREHPPTFNPRELRDFTRALAELRFVAGPIASRSETRGAKGSHDSTVDAIRERQRLYLRRVLNWLRALSQDIVEAIHDNGYPLNPWEIGRRNCLNCKSRNRDSAHYCDHCGLKLPTVP